MTEYTKYGKNRYKFLFFDENQKHINTISEGINNENVIDKMEQFGVNMSKGSWIYENERIHHKTRLNEKGFWSINDAGFLAVMENQDYGSIRTPNYRIIFIDMTQIDKLIKINLFKTTLKSHLN